MTRIHRVITPEQTAVEFDIAGIGSRAIAAMIDTAAIVLGDALLIGAAAVLQARFFKGGLAGAAGGPGAYLLAVLVIGIFGFTVLYYILFEGLGGGRTPGKRLLRLRVIGADGRAISLFASIVRNLVRIVDFLPTGYLVGMVLMLVTRREQRLGDLAAGTLVVRDRPVPARPRRRAGRRARKRPEVESAAGSAAAAPQEPEIALAARLVEPARRVLARSFLERAEDFRPERRAELAERVVAALLRDVRAARPDVAAWAAGQDARRLLAQLQRAWDEAESKPPDAQR